MSSLELIRICGTRTQPGTPISVCFFICLTSTICFYIHNKEEKWLKGIIILLSIMSVLMGLSRILLSHHYATDVIAGVLFGALFGIMDFYLYKYFPNFVAFLKSKFKKA